MYGFRPSGLAAIFCIKFLFLLFHSFIGEAAPQADFAQGDQSYVIQHPWPGTEGPLTIKKQGVQKKNPQPKKDLAADAVVVA